MTGPLPTFDLAQFQSGDDAARLAAARALDAACRSFGFFQLEGHRVPRTTLEAMLRASDEFFALPLDDKKRVAPPSPDVNRGYAASGTEALRYSLGDEAPHPDLFEAFNVGPEDLPNDAFYGEAPHGFFAPNLWPSAVPALRPAVLGYLHEAARVALELTDAFALALGFREGELRRFVDRSTLTLRINHYERRSGDHEPSPEQLRMGEHTDYGIVTVLYADPVPGLQILGPDGAWLDVVPDPGKLLVNLGDLTARWTNDRWRSTLHRVLPPPPHVSGPFLRRSAALFFDGNYDATIECLTTCLSEGDSPRYAPVKAGDHLVEKLLGPRLGRPSRATSTARGRI